MKYSTPVEKRDQILHDLFLWNNPIPVNEAPITSVKAEALLENNIKDRLDILDFSASITASFMGGLVSVS